MAFRRTNAPPIFGKLLLALVLAVMAAAAYLSLSGLSGVFFRPVQANATPMPSPSGAFSPVPSVVETTFCSGESRDGTCPESCPLAADIDCCLNEKNCWIALIGCVVRGTDNGACTQCNPLLSSTDWSDKPFKTQCPPDANPCTSDYCSQGECSHPNLGDGEACPQGACCGGTCAPKPSCSNCQDGPLCENGGWVCKNKAKGAPCEIPETAICAKGQCDGTGNCNATILQSYCFIENACFTQQSSNPSNECQQCAPTYSATAWQNKPDATSCADDGNDCTSDSCKQGACSHGKKPAGTACTDDGLTCTLESCNSNAECVHQVKQGFCAINGACFADGQGNPASECQQCNSQLNATAWSSKANNAPCGRQAECAGSYCLDGECKGAAKPDGTACTADAYSCTSDVCNAGKCTHNVSQGCIVAGACVESNAKNPSNECLACQPSQFAYNWTVLSGATCFDDGNECTRDSCTSEGKCAHPYKSKGALCSPDENPCTSDECNGAGACTHPLKPKGSFCSRTGYCTENIICPGKACDDQGRCTLAGGTCSTCNQTTHSVCKISSCNQFVNYCTNVAGIWKWSTNPSCDDGDKCTKGDACSAGNCIGLEFNPIPECGTYTLLECPATTSKNLTQITVQHFFKTQPSCEGVVLSAIYAEDGSATEAIKTCENNTLKVQVATFKPGYYNVTVSDAQSGSSKACRIRRFGQVPVFEFPDYNLLLLPLLAIAAVFAMRVARKK